MRALIVLLALAAPASAQLRAMDGRNAGGPVLREDRVLVADARDGVLTVHSVPIAGGEAAVFGTLPERTRDLVDLQTGAAGVAALLRDPRSASATGRLFAAGPDGVFSRLAANVGDGPLTP